jgi:Predicted integral membrane protein
MANQQTRRALSPTQERLAETESSVQPQVVPSREAQRQFESDDGSAKRLATALGWFSIGLGLAEVLAPRGLAKLIGVRNDYPILFRVLGLREITSGVGILTQHKPAGWLWSRVAGDAMDLSLLCAALNSDDSDRTKVAMATAAVIGVTALDILNAQQLSGNQTSGGIVRVKSITINRKPEEVYHFWRNFENLPRFMSHLESVHVIDERRSHWVAKAPAGMKVEWDAEITEDRPNELIAWRSLEGTDVENSGSVRFASAPGGRGTEVKVSILYNPPGGAIGAGIAKLFGEEPEQQIKGDLRRFKQVMETGEVVHSDASIHRGLHPAQPASGQPE